MSWPTLHPAALHGLAGQVVRTLKPETEADPAALLGATLTRFGSMVGAGPHVRVGGDRHPARLFIVNVGDTARARKGTAASLTRLVTDTADAKWSGRELSGFGSGEAVVDAVRDATEDDPGPGDRRLLIREPEFARILNVAARDGSVLSPIIREAWDGYRLAVRTRKTTVVATVPHVSVLADCTLDELRRGLTATEVANGFANRFAFFAVRRSQLLPSGGNLDDQDVRHLAHLFGAALTEARKVGRMTRTEAAEELWADAYRTVATGADDLYGTTTARADSHMLRLSVTYALLDGAHRIDSVHVEAAIAVWAYAEASAQLIFADRTGNPDADKLLAALRVAGDPGLEGSQQHEVFGRHLSAARLSAARKLLEDRGLAVTVDQPTGGRPLIRTVATCEASESSEESSRLDSLLSLLSHLGSNGQPPDPENRLPGEDGTAFAERRAAAANARRETGGNP